METILATWPGTQTSPVNGEKRNVTLRSKMHSAQQRLLQKANEKKCSPYIDERKAKLIILLSMCMCANMSFSSRDKPFCCASSRCSPPQRRALQRRVAPFSDTRVAPVYSLCYPTPYPRFRAVFPCCSSDVKHKNPPPPPYFHCASSLAFPSETRFAGGDLKLQLENTSCMQIAVGVTSNKGAVVGAGLVAVPLSGAVGESVITILVAFWTICTIVELLIFYKNTKVRAMETMETTGFNLPDWIADHFSLVD